MKQEISSCPATTDAAARTGSRSLRAVERAAYGACDHTETKLRRCRRLTSCPPMYGQSPNYRRRVDRRETTPLDRRAVYVSGPQGIGALRESRRVW